MPPDLTTTGLPAAPAGLVGRRSTDRARQLWAGTRDVLLASLTAPARPLTRPVLLLAGAVLVAEAVGLVVRLACTARGCATEGWAARLDMDALGSLPRALITAVLLAAALVCLRGLVTAGRVGAGTWWTVVGLGCTALALAKHTSLHSVVEGRLAGALPGTDVQLLFVVVSTLGLLAVVVSGRWVRRGTRTAVATWLGLYAAASVGLAALTLVLGHLGPVAADLATFVEESAEGLAAVGLLAVLHRETRAVSRRTPPPPTTRRPGVRPAPGLPDEEHPL